MSWNSFRWSAALEAWTIAFRQATHSAKLARSVQTGQSPARAIDQCAGKAAEISFDPKFLLEMLRMLEPETKLTLELVDANSPALPMQAHDEFAEPLYVHLVARPRCLMNGMDNAINSNRIVLPTMPGSPA